MEKRVSKRILSRVKVHFGTQEPDGLGYALNLSAGGLYLSSTRIFPPRTDLRIRLAPVEGMPIDVRGQVRWGLRVPQGLLSVIRPGMGIRLESPPHDYLDYFSHLVKMCPLRASPRVDAHLEVRFYHRELLVREYTENISRGGLFIATEEVFEPGAEIAVDLVIPDLATVWHVTGRVAYRLDAQKARQLDSLPGIGIQITDADSRVEEAFRAYVRRIMQLYE
ncbi:MAG TPA: PilZ domain-containing protein [Candidatus Methanoperedens sp.]|nr:PilZ domain-containing protein [Candidatus Methanoperedens sp.]